MKEDNNNFREEDFTAAVDRFKRSLISGKSKYFDVSEFEGIVEQLLEEGDLNSSEIAAKQGIQIHPNAVPLQLKYSQVLLNKGKYQKALQYINLAEKVDGQNPDVYLIKGSIKVILGNEPEALISFKKAIKNGGSEIDDILYQIGTTYVQVGEISKACYYFEKAVKANPNHEMALYDLGFFFDQLNNYKKSIKYYNQYLDIDPYNHLVWFNLGTVHNKLDKHKKAIEAYEFAYAINDKFHLAIFNIGNALANANKFNEAIEKYKEFLQFDEKNDDAYCYIGECYLNLEDYKQSESNYRKALKINIKNDTAWFGIGLIMWIEQKFEDSISHIKKAIKIDKQNSEYWLTLGKVNSDFNQTDEAMKAFKKAAKIDPQNTETWLTWAELFVSLDEKNNAFRILKKGINNNPDAILKYRLVALYLETKKQKEAFYWLKTAMQQEFEQINYLFDIFPESLKNKKLKKVVDDFRSKNDNLRNE